MDDYGYVSSDDDPDSGAEVARDEGKKEHDILCCKQLSNVGRLGVT